MSLPAAEKYLTEAEFLEMERRAETKSEFFEGEVFAMAGGSREHSIIGANLLRALGNRLENRACIVYNPDMRVKIEETGLLTYPDVTVVCGPERFSDDLRDTLLNPTLVAEVLSDSTEGYDRGTKFHHYRLVRSLQSLLFVGQREPRVECYSRLGDEWRLTEAIGLDATLEIPDLEIKIPLSEIFAKIEFSLRPPRLHRSPQT